MIGAIAAAVAVRLGAGLLFAGGALAWRHRVPPAFFRFLVSSAAGAFALSLVLAWGQPEWMAWAGLAVLTVVLGVVERRSAKPRGESPTTAARGPSRGLAAAAMLLGLVGAISPLLTGSGDNPLREVAAEASAAMLLGSVTATMVLGHWYLVDTGLSIAPLASGARLYLGAAGLRVLVTTVALLTGGVAALGIASVGDLIYSTTALFFSFRALTGLAAPFALAVLIRSTVRIRSTQSATGLLYVALILVLFGELTAVFLERISGHAIL